MNRPFRLPLIRPSSSFFQHVLQLHAFSFRKRDPHHASVPAGDDDGNGGIIRGWSSSLLNRLNTRIHVKKRFHQAIRAYVQVQ